MPIFNHCIRKTDASLVSVVTFSLDRTDFFPDDELTVIGAGLNFLTLSTPVPLVFAINGLEQLVFTH